MNGNRLLRVLPSLCFILAAFLFFGLGYGSHLAYQEQYQLFEWTPEYFAGVVSVPGGFADWCGRFLTQFFVMPWVGAGIVSLTLGLVWWLCFLAFGRVSKLGYVMSYLPAILLFGYLLDSSALMGGVVAVVISLAAALTLRLVPCCTCRCAVILVLSPVIYYLAGPVGVLFALLSPKNESAAVRIAAAALFVASPFVASLWCHYPLKDLLAGVHYYRLPHNIVWSLWVPVILIVVANAYLPKLFFKKSRGENLAVAVTAAVLILVAVLVVIEKADWEGEEIMTYDRLVAAEDWDGVVALALKKSPDKPFTVCCLNLALAKQNQLGDKMFRWAQAGEKGLFPSYSISYTALLPTSEVYWQLGMVNACQQYVFETQEAIPDFQKSARCYKRLAQTNILNGDWAVAAKYLKALQNTLFYREWARQAISSLDVPVDYSSRMEDPHMLFNENDKASMLFSLFEKNPGNRMALQYLVSCKLLEKDSNGASSIIMQYASGDALPKHWQEALIMACVEQKADLASLPSAVSKENISRMMNFISDMRNKVNQKSMEKKYGDTFWYYCIYI